jgi:hypothetical protein
MYIRLHQINAKIFLKDMMTGYRKCVVGRNANQRRKNFVTRSLRAPVGV